MKKIYYFDENDNIVDEDNATYFVAHEYNENGKLINEIFGTRPLNKKLRKSKMDIIYTEEEIEFLNNIVDDKGNHPFKK